MEGRAVNWIHRSCVCQSQKVTAISFLWKSWESQTHFDYSWKYLFPFSFFVCPSTNSFFLHFHIIQILWQRDTFFNHSSSPFSSCLCILCGLIHSRRKLANKRCPNQHPIKRILSFPVSETMCRGFNFEFQVFRQIFTNTGSQESFNRVFGNP